MNIYACTKCGHEVYAGEMPVQIKWSDGHICYFTDVTGMASAYWESRADYATQEKMDKVIIERYPEIYPVMFIELAKLREAHDLQTSENQERS